MQIQTYQNNLFVRFNFSWSCPTFLVNIMGLPLKETVSARVLMPVFQKYRGIFKKKY